MGRLLFIFISISHILAAQPTPRLLLEMSSGVQVGWWIYNKGSDVLGVFNNLGWDRTRNVPLISLEVEVLYQTGRLRLGVAANRGSLLAEEMIGSRDAVGIFDQYPIARKSVQIYKMALVVEYDLAVKGNYFFSPYLQGGTFFIQTLHPAKENFGLQTALEFGLNNQVKISRWRLVFKPNYTLYAINPKRKIAYNEKHTINTLGLILGARYQLI